MQLRKKLNLIDVSLKMEGDTGTFEGYASKWDGVDSYGDTIVKGAFAETLRTNGQPKLYLEHSWKFGGALLPVGKATCEEDSTGLFLRGELTPGLSIASDVRAAMKHGTIDGLSIGGLVKKGDYEESNGRRLIKKWHNLFDVSIVTNPADGAARIDLSSVKSIDFEALLPECKTERDIEQLLRDAGLGKWEAMALVSRAKTILSGRDAPQDAEAKAMAELVKRCKALEAIGA
jgi:HK97 family phage prohead protease